ncbi:MAG: hypothetical protein ABIX01_02485 [Chitinophagaceae bacterium]
MKVKKISILLLTFDEIKLSIATVLYCVFLRKNMEIKNEGDTIIIKTSSPEMAKKVVNDIEYARFLELSKNIAVTDEDINIFMEGVNESQREYVKQRYQL